MQDCKESCMYYLKPKNALKGDSFIREPLFVTCRLWIRIRMRPELSLVATRWLSRQNRVPANQKLSPAWRLVSQFADISPSVASHLFLSSVSGPFITPSPHPRHLFHISLLRPPRFPPLSSSSYPIPLSLHLTLCLPVKLLYQCWVNRWEKYCPDNQLFTSKALCVGQTIHPSRFRSYRVRQLINFNSNRKILPSNITSIIIGRPLVSLCVWVK